MRLLVLVWPSLLHIGGLVFFFFFKQKTAYEMRISDWSSDVCSSDLRCPPARRHGRACSTGLSSSLHPPIYSRPRLTPRYECARLSIGGQRAVSQTKDRKSVV